MAIVGITFRKICAEKKNIVKGKVTIANDLSLEKVEEAKIPLADSKQTALNFKFNYSTKYEPEIGNIDIKGDVLWVDDSEKNKELLKQYKKDKNVPLDIKMAIFNNILSKATVEALIMSRDVQLPSPIKLPKTRAEEATDSNK